MLKLDSALRRALQASVVTPFPSFPFRTVLRYFQWNKILHCVARFAEPVFNPERIGTISSINAVGSATVSVASSWRPADWPSIPISQLLGRALNISDAFGETPKAAVETTALPQSKRIVTA
jgi:hypothetical protein